MRRRYRFIRLLALSLILAGSLLTLPGPARAYPTPTVDLEGHGSGHGLGMGAWGAHGMAVRNPGKPGEEIAAHYFPGARVERWPNEEVRAWLEYDELVDTVVGSASPFTVWDLSGGSQNLAATSEPLGWGWLRVVRVGGGLLQIQKATSPDGAPGGWSAPDQQVGPPVAGPVEFRPPEGPQDDDPARMLLLQLPTERRYFRGRIRGLLVGEDVYTVNVLPVQEYLYGVMRVEGAPSRWDGPGREGLRALAIVARSYALHKRMDALAGGRAYDLCSTSNCQNYRGWGSLTDSGPARLEDPRTNAAVDTTSDPDGAARVLVYGNPPAPVLGAYASSSGGYTKPGPHPYLAPVPDPDDDFPDNPSHLWRVSLPVSAVEEAWPQIGRLLSVSVLERNGYGDWGGRVTRVRIEGTAGAVTETGNGVRGALGLKSDWFRVLLPVGYWILGADGGVFSFGTAQFHGSTGGLALSRPVVGMAATPAAAGYWLVAADGGIFAFGDARFQGSTGSQLLNRPIVGMAPTPTGQGYWLVASDGGIFAFGDARFQGSTGSQLLNRPIVGMAPTPTGQGYWLVASDGGIFAFGDARFQGSTGSLLLNRPIVGMAPTPTGQGYWLVASDGGIFAFGDAAFRGSTASLALNRPIVAMSATPTGDGYLLVASDGGIFTFGDAVFAGSVPGAAPASTTPKIAIALSYTAHP